MSLIVGIDPGKKGALALLDSYGELLEIEDMPLAGNDVQPIIVADILNGWVTDQDNAHETVTCVIEDVFSMPKQGVSSMFSFGRSKGVVEGAAAGVGMRLVYVTPAQWKRQMKVTKEKGSSRDLAINRWPKFSPWFKRVMDDGRAEAALIALWQVQHGQ